MPFNANKFPSRIIVRFEQDSDDDGYLMVEDDAESALINSPDEEDCIVAEYSLVELKRITRTIAVTSVAEGDK